MSNIWNVQVLGDSHDGTTVEGSTSVYVDTELEARVSGAAQLGVSPDRVTVTLNPTSNPSDDELMAMWAEARRNQTVNTETTGGSAYG